MGRNAQPIAVLKQTKKKHLTKKEIEARETSEIRIGSDVIVCPETIKNDLVAYKKWVEIIKDYKQAKKNGADIFKSSDVGILERYCINYSMWIEELNRLKRTRKLIDKKDIRKSIRDTQKEMRADEDRLLLNILAKIKNVPQQERKQPHNPMEKEYGI